jgi:hypothetical protein
MENQIIAHNKARIDNTLLCGFHSVVDFLAVLFQSVPALTRVEFKSISCLVVLLLAATGCSPVKIESPQFNDVFVDVPADFYVSWRVSGEETLPFDATLNGLEVSSVFQVTEGGASATGAVLLPYLKHGVNRFVVRSPGYRLMEFTMDMEGPDIHITEVDDSEYPAIRVKGYVDDPSEVVSFGYEYGAGYYRDVALNENVFEVLLDGNLSDKWIFIAKDSGGHINEAPFSGFENNAAYLIQAENALALKINKSGLDFASNVGPEVLNQVDIIEALKAANPIIDTLFIIYYRIYIEDGTAEIHWVDLAPSDLPGMDLDISVLATARDLKLTLCTQTLFGEKPLCLIKGTLEQVSFFTDFSVNLEGKDKTIALAENGLDIDTVLVGNIDTGNAFLSYLVTVLKDIITLFNVAFDEIFRVNIVGEIVEDIVIPVVQKLFDPLLISSTAALKPQGQEVHEMHHSISFNEMFSTDDSFVVRLNTEIESSSIADVPKQLGVRDYGAAPVDVLKGYDFGLTLSTTLFNQALDMVYHLSALSLPVEHNGGSLFHKIRYQANPLSPPFIKIGQSEQFMAEIVYYDLQLKVQVQRTEDSAFEDLASIVMEINVPFDLISVDAERSLGAKVSPLLNVQLTEVRLHGNELLMAAEIHGFLNRGIKEAWVPLLVGQLNGAIGMIQLPSIFGLRASPKVFDVDRKSGSFIVAGDLLELP